MSGVRNSARCTYYPRASLLFNKPNRSTLSTPQVLCNTNLKTRHSLSREKQLHVTRAIPGVSTICVEILSDLPTQNQRRNFTPIYMGRQFSRKSPTTVYFYLWEKLKTLAYSVPKGNRHFSNACKIIHNGRWDLRNGATVNDRTVGDIFGIIRELWHDKQYALNSYETGNVYCKRICQL